MSHHNLKCFHDRFVLIASGKMVADPRSIKDRNFLPGDTITYHDGEMWNGEFVPTGETLTCRIGYVDDYAMDPEMRNLSLIDQGMIVSEGLSDIFATDPTELLSKD